LRQPADDRVAVIDDAMPESPAVSMRVAQPGKRRRLADRPICAQPERFDAGLAGPCG
jgi:hypothetical protein